MKETTKTHYLHGYEKIFGWKVVNTRHYHSGRSHHTEYTLERDLNITEAQLKTLKELESKYDNLDSDNRYLPSADVEIALILLLCLIIPGVLYLVYWHNKKKKAKLHQANARREMKQIEEQVKSLIGTF